MRLTVAVLTVLALSSCATALKVVLFATDISGSQTIWNKRVSETLARAGHDVTVYVIASYKTKPSKVSYDSSVKVEYVDAMTGATIDDFMKDNNEVTFTDIPFYDSRQRNRLKVFEIIAESCEPLITNTTFIDSVKAAKFDIAFTHMYTFCGIGIVKLTGIPTWAWLVSAPLVDHIGQAIGLPAPPSYCAHMMMDAGEDMDYPQRIKSWFANILTVPAVKFNLAGVETGHFRKHYGRDFPDLFEFARECPLVFVNTMELYDFGRPTLHKIVNIGGIGIDTTAKNLTGEIAKRVESAEEGIIVMTFGSFAPMHLMPNEWKKSISTSFSRFPKVQFFIRYELESDFFVDSLPKNVYVSKWLPQNDLLQHPKCKGLITHGGYNSLQDTLHAGVPAVTIALFGDQPRNARLAEKLGVGINLRKPDVGNAVQLSKAINRLLHDESLSYNAKRLRKQIEMRPMSSEQLLVKWTEFLAEFKTLEHLVPYGNNLNFFVYYSLDVMTFVAIVVFIVGFFTISTMCKIFRCVRFFCEPYEKIEKRKVE